MFTHCSDLFTDTHWIDGSAEYVLEFVTAMAWDSCHKSNFESLTFSSNEKKNEKIQWLLAAFKNNSMAQKKKGAEAKPCCT